MSLELVNSMAVWNEAAPLIAHALEGSDDTVDDVLQRCSSGHARILASERAFVVVEPVPSPRGFDLMIWAAASRGATDCIATHLVELEDIGRTIGAAMLVFRTEHRGFERLMPAGWSIKQYVWAKEL